MICGIIATISIAVLGFFSLPTLWFWISWEILAGGLVAVGCVGEWILFRNPAEERNKLQKEHHRRRELQCITAVAIGVVMEFVALAHAIPEAIRLEAEVASIETTNAQLVASNLGLQSNVNETRIELENTQIRLAKVKNALPPRSISEKQRELFITTFLETNALSSPKIDIKVFVQDVDDPEAEYFADFVRRMLNDAGYGTNGEEVIKVQPFNVSPSDSAKNGRMPQIFAVFAIDNNGNKIPLSMPGFGGSITPFIPTKIAVQAEVGNPKIPVACYYSNNPNDILGGVRNILNYIGVPIAELTVTNLLKPYEVGLYVPPQG